MTELRALPLTHDVFAPFGKVIEVGGPFTPINDGTTRRYGPLAGVEAGGGTAGLSIFCATAWPRPLRLKMMERHPLATQAFMPLTPGDWLIVVAVDPAGPLSAFHARADQGVQYATGIWHHPLIALEPTQDFLVVDRVEQDGNLDIHTLDPTVDLLPGDPL